MTEQNGAGRGRWFVTGASGFVGSHLLKRLLKLGFQSIRAVSHRRKSRIINPRIEHVSFDLSERSSCIKVTKHIDWIFHCAATTSGAAVMINTPLAHVTPNIIMNAQLFQAAYDAGVKKVLWLSSTTGYPPSGKRLVKEDEMFQGMPDEKYFCVGWMKRFSEILCQMYAERTKNKMNIIVVRPSNVYGEHDNFDPKTSHVIPALIRKIVKRQQPLEVWGDGKDLKDFIYIKDCIDGLILAMNNMNGFDQINIASGNPITINEILDMLLELDGYDDAEVVYNKDKPTMIPRRLIDTEKAERTIGFKAKTPTIRGLNNMMKWYRSTL